MRLSTLGTLAFISLGFSGCSPMTLERHSAGYENVVAKQKDVLILPSEVYVETIDYLGAKERKHDYEYHLEKIIDREMLPAIEEKGFKAKRLTRRDIHNQKLIGIVADLRAGYESKRAALYKENFWDGKRAFGIAENIGAIAVELGESTKSDLLVFVDFLGTSKTRGAQTIEILTDALMVAFSGNSARNSDPSEEAVMIIGIIDAKTGNILWSNKSIGNVIGMGDALERFEHDDTISSKEIKTLIRAILKPFNKQLKK